MIKNIVNAYAEDSTTTVQTAFMVVVTLTESPDEHNPWG